MNRSPITVIVAVLIIAASMALLFRAGITVQSGTIILAAFKGLFTEKK